MSDTLISVSDLKVHFPIPSKGLFGGVDGYVRAVDGVTFDIRRGETLGLVGESGSGKTTVGRAILRAITPTGGAASYRHKDGAVTDLLSLSGETLRQFRRNMQLIFQDPYSSLNPRMTVRDIIAEPLDALGGRSRDEIDARVREIASKCKLNLEHLRRFPHAFSGGQRQRICIARALISAPEFIVCDESVSALDVSIQAEILNLLGDLQEELGLSYLFIAHDLSVVAHIAHRVAVMYVGKIVEIADSRDLFARPKHPYTRALISSAPKLQRGVKMRPERLTGEIPNPANLPPGCRFQTRCPFAEDLCRREDPPLRRVDGADVACHFVEKIDARAAAPAI